MLMPPGWMCGSGVTDNARISRDAPSAGRRPAWQWNDASTLWLAARAPLAPLQDRLRMDRVVAVRVETEAAAEAGVAAALGFRHAADEVYEAVVGVVPPP